jgi:hypothetical protein
LCLFFVIRDICLRRGYGPPLRPQMLPILTRSDEHYGRGVGSVPPRPDLTVTCARVLIAGWIAFVPAMTAPAAASADPTLSVGQEELTVTGDEGADTGSGYLTVLNGGKTPATAHVTFEATSNVGVKMTPTLAPVAPGSARRIKVTFTGLKRLAAKATGELVVAGGTETVERPVSITPGLQPSASWLKVFFLGALGLAALFVVLMALCVVAVGGGVGRLFTQSPGPKWKFDSWATTATAVGAVLGTVLAAVTLPAVPKEFDKDTLVQLNLLFAGLLVLAPFLFQAMRRPGASVSDQVAGLYGFNVTLLLACALTLAAVTGELATLGLLMWELIGGGTWAVAAVSSLGVVAVLALWYIATTTWRLVCTDWPNVPAPATVAAVEALDEAAPATAALVPARLSWSLP